MNEPENLAALDQELVDATRDIKVLSELAWDAKYQGRFIEGWQKGKPELPDVTYRPVDHSRQQRQLDSIIDRAAKLDHPLGNYVKDTAQSYLDVASMIASLGTGKMTDFVHSDLRTTGRPDYGG